jgi:putative tricarboxylic transport membrane protein
VSLDEVSSGRSAGPGAPGSGATPTSPAAIELETPTHRGDVIAALLCLSGGLTGYFIVVPAAVYVPSNFAGTVNSPAFLPNVLFVLLAVLGVIYLAQSLAAFLREPAQGRVRPSDWILAGGTALICIGYIGAIYVVGMTLASALCVAATIYYFGERRAWLICAIAIILPALLWYFFVKIAHILFPTPWLGVMEWLESARLLDGTTDVARLILPLAG